MKFVPLEEIRAGGAIFEMGNQYTLEKYAHLKVTESMVRNWHSIGICRIQGQPDKPRRQPIKRPVSPQNQTVTSNG